MSKLLYFGLGTLFGGAIGATVSYFLTKKKINDEADREIEEMRQYYLEKAEKLIKDNEKETNSINTPSEAVEAPQSDSKQSKAKFPTEEEKPSMEAYAAERGILPKNYTNYSNYYQSNKGDGPEEETGEGENLAHPSAEIYEIEDSQYFTECLNYEKREFRYYIEDETLCNEEDEVLEPKYTVGESAIKTLLKDEVELIYVRNDVIHIDYEVQKMFGSYNEQVLGQYGDEED